MTTGARHWEFTRGDGRLVRPDLDVARYRITANPAAFAFLLRRGAAFLEDVNQATEAA